jgi:hypothetical protein
MNFTKPKVLLIGEASRGYSPLSNRLKRHGCDCCIAISIPEVCLLLDKHSFGLVLGPIKLNGDSLYPLVRRLDGSETTLFYSQAVEDGCWWVPALRWGKNCFGLPALRPSEFVYMLDETIQEIRSTMQKAAETRTAIASLGSGSIVTRTFSNRPALSAMPVSAQGPKFITHKAAG